MLMIAVAHPASRRGRRPAVAPLRVGVIAPLHSDAITAGRRMGLELGLAEAQRAAQLFGGSVEMIAVTAATMPGHTLSAVIGGDPEQMAAIGVADRAGILYMNVSSPAQSLRGAGCRRTLFHIIPSEVMYHDAVALASPPGGVACAWDATLVKFGADTLNQRFRARFNQPMSEQAWTAWFAMKVLWESSLRARSTTPAALIDYLRHDGTQFDGHKGRPLSFRSWDNQLRQPMYVRPTASNGATASVVEVPAPSDESARDALDKLGGHRGSEGCSLTGHPS
jgi:hypothetical protein